MAAADMASVASPAKRFSTHPLVCLRPIIFGLLATHKMRTVSFRQMHLF